VLFRANFDILSEYQFDDDNDDDDDIDIEQADVTTASYYEDSALIQQDNTDDTGFDSRDQQSQAHCWTTDHHNPPQSYVRTLEHLID